MRRGEIRYVALDPAVGSQAAKYRPCVVVSNDRSNRAVERHGRGIVTMVPLTSNLRRALPFPVELPAGFGLPRPSKVRAEQVRSVAFERIGPLIGRLPMDLMVRVDAALRLHLGLSRVATPSGRGEFVDCIERPFERQGLPVRVLGVDPGLTRCGIGVVDGAPGRALHLVAVDVVRTAPDLPLAERLALIADRIEAELREHRPDVLAVERVFSQHNVRTVMGTAQVSGVAMLAAARAGVPVALHTPSEVKAAVTGSGRADKAQVGAMVMRLLRLDAVPKPADAADALALAVCHVWRGTAQNRLQRAVAAVRGGTR
jgi:crossover junction endodeoxyribonuclease RuvC